VIIIYNLVFVSLSAVSVYLIKYLWGYDYRMFTYDIGICVTEYHLYIIPLLVSIGYYYFFRKNLISEKERNYEVYISAIINLIFIVIVSFPNIYYFVIYPIEMSRNKCGAAS
jgi:hypothetical protein